MKSKKLLSSLLLSVFLFQGCAVAVSETKMQPLDFGQIIITPPPKPVKG